VLGMGICLGRAWLFNRSNITKPLYILCSVSFLKVFSISWIRSNARVLVIKSATWTSRRKGNVRDDRQGSGYYYKLKLVVYRYLVKPRYLLQIAGFSMLRETSTLGQLKGERYSISWNQVKNSLG
jgi:hypothetical protein